MANISAPLLLWLRVDDAVGASCVHGRSDERQLNPVNFALPFVIPFKRNKN